MTTAKLIAGSIAVGVLGAVLAQPPAATLEERVRALESAFATLDTRVARQPSRTGTTGESDIALSGRITELERAVERLASDVQRAERLADNASRAASEAQRAATSAQQAARDAAMRTR